MNLKKMAVPVLILLLFALLSGCTAPSVDIGLPYSSASAPFDSSEPPDNNTTSVLTSSTENPEIAGKPDQKLLSLHKEIKANGFFAGIAFIGYVGDEKTESELRSFLKSSQYIEKYAFLADAPFVDAGGKELYAVATAEKECSASVYRAVPGDSGKYNVQTDDALYVGDGMDCFLLRCNVSDIHANVGISFKTGETSFSVFPMLSGIDGQLAAEGCYDFSIYAEGSHSPNSDAIIAYGLLSEAEEVRYYMNLGMTLQYTGQTQIIDGRSCWIFALGTEHEGQFVKERLYGVCDNLIYTYDALSDTWSVLIAE